MIEIPKRNKTNKTTAFHVCEALWAADFLVNNRTVVDRRLRRAIERRVPLWQEMLSKLPPGDVEELRERRSYLFPNLPYELPSEPDLFS